MRLYQFMKADHGISALQCRRLKISRIHELNDPFEFVGVDQSDPAFRKGLFKTKRTISQHHGLLCFSKTWKSPIMWAHYAGNHTGVCLGFDLSARFCKAVDYVEARFPKPATLDEEFIKALLFSKFSHWAYEQEYRCHVQLDEDEGGLYFKAFDSDLKLAEVIVGSRSKLKRAEVRKLVKPIPGPIKMRKARAAFTTFEMTEQNNAALWA